MKKKTIVFIVVEQKHQKRLRVAKITRSHQKRIFRINKSPRLLQYSSKFLSIVLKKKCWLFE